MAEVMLQLPELSSKNLTNHEKSLEYISRIAGSKVYTLRTYRAARHALLCVIKPHVQLVYI